MVTSYCIYVKMAYNATLGNMSVYLPPGTYLDTVDNATLLRVIPKTVKVCGICQCLDGAM